MAGTPRRRARADAEILGFDPASSEVTTATRDLGPRRDRFRDQYDAEYELARFKHFLETREFGCRRMKTGHERRDTRARAGCSECDARETTLAAAVAVLEAGGWDNQTMYRAIALCRSLTPVQRATFTLEPPWVVVPRRVPDEPPPPERPRFPGPELGDLAT